jgi:hypothetical protein
MSLSDKIKKENKSNDHKERLENPKNLHPSCSYAVIENGIRKKEWKRHKAEYVVALACISRTVCI